jgi:phosphatidylglycerol:prolipoprotein diacylglycerol transferase
MHVLAYFVAHPHPYLWQFGDHVGIRFYSLAYLTGFYILFVGLRWQAARGWSRLKGDAIADYVTWVAIAGVILGGRLGYCLLYEPHRTFTDPLSFFQLWNGGMASHGGIVGVILVMIFFGRAKKIPFYDLADATAFCVPVTLGLGRCANFLNGELWGRPTDAWWGVIFPGAPPVYGYNVPRYPSQLIEALLEGVLLQLVLVVVRILTRPVIYNPSKPWPWRLGGLFILKGHGKDAHKDARTFVMPKFREGAVALTFMAGYAILRIVGEQFREPDEDISQSWGITNPFMSPDGLWFGVLSQGQLLSALMLLATAFLAWRQFRARPGAGAAIESSPHSPSS